MENLPETPPLDINQSYIFLLENSPSCPFASPHRLGAVLRVLGLSFHQALEAAGVALVDVRRQLPDAQRRE